MKETLNIILPTIRFLPLTRDLIRNLIAAVEEMQGIHLTIADGQEDEQKKQWILSRTKEIASQGQFTYIRIKNINERLRRAVARETEWIFLVSDDDIMSVNLIRAIYESTQTASTDVSAITPLSYLPYGKERWYLHKVEDIAGDTQRQRLIALLRQAHILGELMWSAIRRKYYLEWLDYALAKPIGPTYMDQVLVAYLAMRGKMLACKEMCIYAKDNQVWFDFNSSVAKDATGYPHKDATLLHELFMVSDIYTLLAAHGLEDEALIPLCIWTTGLLKNGADLFDARQRTLGITQSPECDKARSLMNSLAAESKALAAKPIKQYRNFFNNVQSICAILIAAPSGNNASAEEAQRIPA